MIILVRLCSLSRQAPLLSVRLSQRLKKKRLVATLAKAFLARRARHCRSSSKRLLLISQVPSHCQRLNLVSLTKKMKNPPPNLQSQWLKLSQTLHLHSLSVLRCIQPSLRSRKRWSKKSQKGLKASRRGVNLKYQRKRSLR